MKNHVEFKKRSLALNGEPEVELVQTRTMLMKKRRQNEIKSNLMKFSTFAKGVHGYDIPNFQHGSFNEKMYWKNKKDYEENPMY